MNDAELYHKHNTLQRRDAMQCLEEYSYKIKWKNYDSVADLGCGDGGVTTSILQKIMPEDFKKLVGYDICKEMVEFANEHYGDERTSFKALDLEERLPETLSCSYDHIFSFYTLHWINNQRQAFTNIYQMLVEGGDCLLVFLGHMPLYDTYRIMSRLPKWQWWLRNVDDFISPYHDSQESEKDVQRLMASVGFKNISVEVKENTFFYNRMDHYKKSIIAVNPFNIPPELQDDYFEDFLSIIREMDLIDEANNNIDEYYENYPGDKKIHVKLKYCLLVAYGSK